MKSQLCTFLALLLLITACAAPPPPPAPTITPFPTQALPTATVTPPPSVLAGTPISLPQTAITIDNLSHLSPLAHWSKGNIVQIEVNPDGSLLAVATPLGIYLYDSETFDETSFIEVKNWVSNIAFSPDGTMLASGALDGTVQLWQISDGTPKKTLKGPLGSITSLAFSRSGNILAAGGAEGSLFLFDLTTQATQSLIGHTARVHSLIFAPDEATLISGSDDLTVRFWQFANGTLQRTITVKTKSLDAVALSTDGTLVATGSRDGNAHFWGVSDGALKKTMQGVGQDVLGLAFSSNEIMPLLAIASNDNKFS
jgi:WD40 repeat protein